MSETLTKKQWQEKKRRGSERKRRAAVSVQTARIIDKLLERSQDLSGRSVDDRTNAITAYKVFEGAREGKNEAVLTDSVVNYNIGEDRDRIAISTDEHQVKPLFGKQKTLKTATITRSSQDMLNPRIGTNRLEFDSEGKDRPTESYRLDIGPSFSHNMSSEEVVRKAAPALYEIKKAIDDAEEQKSRRAA